MKLFGNKKDAKNLENSKRRAPTGKKTADQPRRGINWTPEEEAIVRGTSSAPRTSGGKREAPKAAAPAPAASAQGKRSAPKKKGLTRWMKAVIIVAAVLLAIICGLLAAVKISMRPPSHPVNPPVSSDPVVDSPNATLPPPDDSQGSPGSDILGYDTEIPATVNENIYNILVVGMDRVGANTDTMIIMSYNAEEQTVSALSLPRDTMVNIKAYYNYKLNSVYASSGIEGLTTVIEGIVGFPIDFHICVDLQAFAEVIDAIGGIEYDVPFRMYYVDDAQNLVIDFQPGVQTLTGKECSNLLRWRQNNSGVYDEEAEQYRLMGDLGRIQLQQRFLEEVMGQMLKVKNLAQIGTISKVMNEYVDTNLTTGELAWIGVQILSNVSISDINFMTLPGEGIYFQNLSYYMIHPNALLSLLNDYFNPYTNATIKFSDLDVIGVENGSIVSYSGREILSPGSETPSAPQTGSGSGDTGDSDDEPNGSTADSGDSVTHILPDGSIVTSGPGGLTIVTPGGSSNPATPGEGDTTPAE
ncbi:MAG: LCP family protein [Oscillospiraceae bacterium]|nr:LCP family protein [Oscillospiraceae bacterium]